LGDVSSESLRRGVMFGRDMALCGVHVAPEGAAGAFAGRCDDNINL
jgi:hypothetical protein